MKRAIHSWAARAALAAVSCLLLPLSATAAVWRTCNGSPVQWRGQTHVYRNRCSIPDTGLINTAFWNGVRQWDALSGVVDGFWVNPATDCSIGHNDGQSEVGLTNRSNIDGANGVTILQLSACTTGPSNINEADVLLADDLDFTAKWGNFRGTVGRSTFVHEFGHFFGFRHEDVHAVLRTTPPHLLTGGNESSTVWPSDALGMNALYGFRAAVNLLPSALGVVGTTVQTLDPALTVTLCRGGSRTTRFYLGNSGNVGSGTYGIRIRLSPVPPFSGYTATATEVASFTHSLGGFSEGTFDLAFRVPSTLPNGTYYIYLDMDPARTIPESNDGDNSTVSAMRIIVNC